MHLTTKILRGSRVKVFAGIFAYCRKSSLLLSTLLLTFATNVQSATSAEQDLLAFYKSAISSPPDVEHFLASQTTLRERKLPPAIRARMKHPPKQTPQFFEGSRSGADFYLRAIAAPDAIETTNSTQLVAGRRGSETYYFNPNTLTYTSDPVAANSANALVSIGNSFYSVASQFLNMGLAGIQPGSVKWNNVDFTALNDEDIPVYGHLELSNSLPFRLTISAIKGGPGYKAYTYVYPDPPFARGGFPAKTIIWSSFQNELNPWTELAILDIRLAKEKLSKETFERTRFVTTNIVYTNVIENAVLFNVGPDGIAERAAIQPVMQTVMFGMNTTKTIVMLLLILATIGIPLISWKFSQRTKSKSKN